MTVHVPTPTPRPFFLPPALLPQWGTLFASSMRRAGVDVSKVATKQGPTGRSCILSCGGQRTMRTCLAGCPRLAAEELSEADFAGEAAGGAPRWAFLSAYCLYNPGLLERAVELARQAGCTVAFDLASFEVIRAFRQTITQLLEGGAFDVCFCNEDEAAELAAELPGGGGDAAGASADGGGGKSSPEAGLDYLARHCRQMAVVTLGEKVGGHLGRRGHAGRRRH
jgi:sugar/nucleoside kinase (ribokinase family)